MWEEYYFAQNFVAPPIAKKPRCEYNNDYFQPCEYYINYSNSKGSTNIPIQVKEKKNFLKCPSVHLTLLSVGLLL